MKHLYGILFLLITALTFGVVTAQTQTDATSYVVRLNHKDVENTYNPNYHHIKLKLAETAEVRNHVFVDSENAFIVQATSGFQPGVLTQKIGADLVTVAPLPADQYDRLLKRQTAFKLSRMKGAVQVQDAAGFPKNTGGDAAAYQTAIEQWLEGHPEQYRQLIAQ